MDYDRIRRLMSRLHLDIDHPSQLRNRQIVKVSHASDIEPPAVLVEESSRVLGISKKLWPAGAFAGNFEVARCVA